MPTAEKISRREFLRVSEEIAVGLLVGLLFGDLSRDLTRAEASETNPGVKLIGQMDKEGNLWVTQEGLPFSFKLGKGHLFREAALLDDETDPQLYGATTCRGILGYAHGKNDGSEVDGFLVSPDPAHPESNLYYVMTPQEIRPGTIQLEG